jgi:HEAT repeat protein
MNVRHFQKSHENFHPLAMQKTATGSYGLSDIEITLRSGNFHDQWDISKQIPQIGESSVEELLDLLEDETLDIDGRWFVIRSLGNFDKPEVISGLVHLCTSTDDEDLLAAAGEALAQIGTNAVVALTGLLHHPQHRLMAVGALARIHHPATISPLLQVVSDSDARVRATALQALAICKHDAVLPLLVQALEDKASQVRLVAVQGLVNFHQQVGPQDLVLWLTPRLWDLNLAVAQQAVHLLGRLKAESATEALLTVMQASFTPQPLQTAIIQALGWQGTPGALNGLILVWNQVDTRARQDIIRTMEQFSLPGLQNQASNQIQCWLWQMAGDDDATALKRNMLLALGKLGNASVGEVLRSHLADPDPGVRLHAEAALTMLKQSS